MLTRVYQQRPIRQRDNGFFSLVDMAEATGRRVNDWRGNAGTFEYLQALQSQTGIPVGQLLEVVHENGPERGTWAHPLVSTHFAQWASPAFAVQVALWLEDIRVKGYAVDARRAAAPLDLDDAGSLRGLVEALAARRLEDQARIEEQAQQLAEAAPKVEAHDRLMKAEGSYSLMEAGRILGRQPKKLIDTLVTDKVLFRDADDVPMPFAEYRERGFFEVITFAIRCGEVDRERKQTKVTPQGLAYLASRYARTDGVKVQALSTRAH